LHTARYDEASAERLLHEMQARLDPFVSEPHQTVQSKLAHGAPSGATVERCRFELDEQTTIALRAISGHASAALPAAARALATMLYFRYSAHEDLRCAVDATPLSRDGLHGGDTFRSVLKKQAPRARSRRTIWPSASRTRTAA
jgi:hypothetical protein